MARVNVEGIVDQLAYQFRRALRDALDSTDLDSDIDEHELYRNFRRAIGRKTSRWERIHDKYVDVD